MHETILRLNEILCALEGFNPEAMSAALADEGLTIRTVAESLGAVEVLPSDRQADMQAFLDSIPPACAAAALAAVRSALDRGLRVQVTWQPATAFEMRIWEVSHEDRGMVNVFVLSPDPG